MEKILLAGLGYDIIKAFFPIEGEKWEQKKQLSLAEPSGTAEKKKYRILVPGFRIADRGIVRQHNIYTREGLN